MQRNISYINCRIGFQNLLQKQNYMQFNDHINCLTSKLISCYKKKKTYHFRYILWKTQHTALSNNISMTRKKHLLCFKSSTLLFLISCNASCYLPFDSGWYGISFYSTVRYTLNFINLVAWIKYSRCPKYTSNYVKIDVGVFLFALDRVAVSIK